MKIVFMGTPDFAIPSLRKIEKNHTIVAVISQPDRPRGRGRKLFPTPVKAAAQELNLDVFQPENIKDAKTIAILKKLEPEVIVTVAYGQILPKEILNLPPKGCINLHASLLPKYRGAAPIHRAIINGETETGVTTMKMDEGLDTGDILLQEKIQIFPEDTAGSLHDKLAEIGAVVLDMTLKKLSKGELRPEKQDNRKATYAPMLDKDDERIDWNMSARNIFNLVRGLNPWPGAYTSLAGKRLKIWETELISEKKQPGYQAGEIIDIIPDQGIVAATGKGSLVITVLQPSGKKKMSATEFLKGYSVKKGDILGS